MIKFKEQQDKAQRAIEKILGELDQEVPSFGNHPNLGSSDNVVAWYAVELAMARKGWTYSNLRSPEILPGTRAWAEQETNEKAQTNL